MIQDTVHELNVHLQRIDGKLEGFSSPSSLTLGINLDDEKEVTKLCLRICEDAKQFLESSRTSSVLDVNNAAEDHDGFEAQLLMRRTLDENRDSFANIIGQLRNRLESLILENNPEDDKERSRLLDNINASKQCLEICKMASEVCSQKIYRLGEVIADGDSDQVVVTTLADLFDVKKAISKDRSAQLIGSMSGADLQYLTEKRYGSRFGAFAPESNPATPPTPILDTSDKVKSTPYQKGPASHSQSRLSHVKPASNEMRRRMGEEEQ